MASPDGQLRIRVLVIDDEESERMLVRIRLERRGYAVVLAKSGREGLDELFRRTPDIVLLDVVMSGMDGWKTLEQIRSVSDVPVIMLTGQGSELEQVRGLRGGADDYVVKPYSAPELVERIRAVLRRAPPPTVRHVLDDGVVRVDFETREVWVRGEAVELTELETRMLVAFMEHPGLTLSHGQLVQLAWSGAFTAPTEVRTYVRYLRSKIEEDPARPQLIETVRGFGYRYRVPSAPAG
ncbi:MAG TPA: response regulator transcription factor [Gaiellaceae bacterium]|nr:response regulator transcription factor [Gaiellaceae bacterium]